MHIIVCVKSVVRSASGGVTKRLSQNSEMNPFDRPALEAALQLCESVGGSVTALCMGPDAAAEIVCEAMAMGAKRAVLISDPLLAGSDTLVTARVLAAAVRRLGSYDALFFGVRTSDSDTGQVGAQTATALDIPFISGAKKIEKKDREWRVNRVMDEWEEFWRVRSPAAMSIHAQAFAPRPVGLIGISQVYDRPLFEQWRLSDVGLRPEQVGPAGSPTRVAALRALKRDRACDMITGEPRQQVDALVDHLIRKGVMTS